MRFAARLCGVLLLIAATLSLPSCSTDPIAQLESQTAAVTVGATNVVAELLNVWDMIEDNDNDLMPDDGITYRFCESILGRPTTNVTSAPWTYGIRVSVLSADGTTFEQISPESFAAVDANVANYDTTSPSGNSARTSIDVNDGGTIRTFRFLNDRRATTFSRDVVSGTANPLYDLDPATYGPDPVTGELRGLCSQFDPGPATAAGMEQPFTYELGKGDTIRVEVIRADAPLFGLPFAPGQIADIFGALAVDGTPVTVTTTSTDNGFAFNYTSR